MAIYADPDIAAYAFSVDPQFQGVSKSKKYWQDTLDKFFTKYKGLKQKHVQFIQEATTTGKIVSPTGRTYKFEPRLRKGEMQWNISDILNWPNQGLGADCMAVIRIVTNQGRRKRNIQGSLISTVHDSIVWDATTQSIDEIDKLMKDVYHHFPFYMKKYLGIDWNVVMLGETSVGSNMADLNERH